MLLLPPKPIHPPGTAFAQRCGHKPTWKTWQRPEPGWSYQSTVARKSSSLGAQVTSVRSPGTSVQTSGCPATVGTVNAHQAWKHSAALAPHLLFPAVAEAKANKRSSFFVHLLSPQISMWKVKKPWKPRELLTCFEFL